MASYHSGLVCPPRESPLWCCVVPPGYLAGVELELWRESERWGRHQKWFPDFVFIDQVRLRAPRCALLLNALHALTLTDPAIPQRDPELGASYIAKAEELLQHEHRIRGNRHMAALILRTIRVMQLDAGRLSGLRLSERFRLKPDDFCLDESPTIGGAMYWTAKRQDVLLSCLYGKRTTPPGRLGLSWAEGPVAHPECFCNAATAHLASVLDWHLRGRPGDEVDALRRTHNLWAGLKANCPMRWVYIYWDWGLYVFAQQCHLLAGLYLWPNNPESLKEILRLATGPRSASFALCTLIACVAVLRFGNRMGHVLGRIEDFQATMIHMIRHVHVLHGCWAQLEAPVREAIRVFNLQREAGH